MREGFQDRGPQNLSIGGIGATQNPRAESHRPESPGCPPAERFVAGFPGPVDAPVLQDEIVELAVFRLHLQDEIQE